MFAISDCCSDCFGKKEDDDDEIYGSTKGKSKFSRKSRKGKGWYIDEITGKRKWKSSSSLHKHLVPYTFRIPANISHFKEIGTRRAKCPPFHLLLDHVVAVVWCLFSPDASDKKHLGISQLEWALYFLRGVKNNTGKHPADVAIAIRTIEDTLMKYYADMSKLVIRQQAQKKTKTAGESYIKKSSTPQSICGICTETSLIFLPRKSKSTNYNSNDSMDSHMESILNTSPQFSSTRKNKYSDLSKKTQKSYEGLQNNIVQLKTLIAQLSDNDFVKKTESDEAMAELLQGFHQHQIEKIREQMKNLKSIETLLYRDRSDFASSLLNTTSADTRTKLNF